MVLSWRTAKVETGWRFEVLAIHHNRPMQIVRTGTLDTQEKAIARAKSWIRNLKANPAKLNASA